LVNHGPAIDPGAGPTGGVTTTHPQPGPAPTRPPEAAPAGFVESIVAGVRDRVVATVRPAAVVAVAEAFSFPLILMVAVLVFLLAQGRMDDPKFRKAPLSRTDTTVAFEDEDGA
jgi:hypothetical protein